MSQTTTKNLSPFTIGLAFFCMFFGSGNLVFPLFLGQYAEDQWPLVFIGFILAGVLGPLLGVVAMVAYQGDNKRFFATMGSRPALIFVTLLMLVWIPFGAGPRCVRVAYESFATVVPFIPLWAFGALYSVLTFLCIVRKSRMIKILGYYITPILLLSMGVMILLGIMNGKTPESSEIPAIHVFHAGVLHGYQTMDLIASFFFSLSIIAVIKEENLPIGQAMRKTFLSGFIGMVVLALLYLSLTYMSSRNVELLRPLAKDQLLPFISTHFLGEGLSLIPVLAIVLACITTSMAMLSVFADFLRENYMSWDKTTYYSLGGGVAVTYFLSMIPFDGLMAFTSPVLEFSCPLLVGLTIFNLSRQLRSRKKAIEA